MSPVSDSSELPVRFGEVGEARIFDDPAHNAPQSIPLQLGIDLCSKASTKGRRRVAIIGASSAGLITARELLQRGGFDVKLFERKADVGGVYSSKAAYEGAHLTGSCSIVCFGCFPSGEEQCPTYWPIPKFVQYLDNFAEHHQLKQYISFKTSVTATHKITTLDAEGNVMVAVCSKVEDGPEVVDVFHHIIVCTGITGGGYHASEIPKWPGSKDLFQGQILHSSDFKSASDFAGKRVLIVGVGESGSDISLLLCKAGAAKVCVQSRGGPGYVIPRRVLGRAADLDTNRIYHAIPWWLWPRFGWRHLKLKVEERYLTVEDDPEVLKRMAEINKATSEGPKRRFGTKNESFVTAIVRHGAIYKQSEIAAFDTDSVIFADGTIYNCDTVIFCGGYEVRHSILNRFSKGASCAKPRDLYKRIVHPDFGLTISFVGMFRPAVGAIPPVCEMQARLLTQWLSGEKELPDREDMQKTIDVDKSVDMEQYGWDAQRIGALGDFAKWMNDYAEQIGCQPQLTRLFLTDPRLWWHVMAGQLNGMQYRLHGPGAMSEARTSILAMPLMPTAILLIELAICAICKFFSSLGFKAFKLSGL